MTEYDSDEFSDREVWDMELKPYTPASLIARKCRLIAEVADYLLPRVQSAQRQIARAQEQIRIYLESVERAP